jgi:UDP-N-acetylmuramoyl-L-alanyl-D-glutamate--2,6-diaminopimelate ligase
MGKVAARGADLVVLTSDNPRSEDPAAIAAAVEDGLRSGTTAYTVELDRRAAIAMALREARAGDVVLIAGKGHETGQTTGETTIPFDDRVVARELMEAMGCA